MVNLLTLTGLVAMMLSMGLKVTLADVLASARSNRRLVALSLVANYLVVPAVTVALLSLFEARAMVAAGFLILAVCPGAPMGPTFAEVANGDVACAVGQMVILCGLSAFVSPALLSLSLGWLPDDPSARQVAPDIGLAADREGGLRVDYLAIVRTLLLAQIVPLGVGLAIHHRLPRLSERFAKPVGMVANLLLLVVVGLILWQEYATLWEIRPRAWLGMFLLLAASMAIGWLCGGPGLATRKSLAVTTAVRNAAVALVIVSSNFADTPAVTAVIAYALVSIFGSLLCAVALGKIEKQAKGLPLGI
jgi:BASS family bile acid:Na+ symporter